MTQVLFKHIFKGLLTSSFIFGGAQIALTPSATAQENLSIAPSAVQIEQIGAANLAVVSAGGQNIVVVDQSGTNNNAALSVEGTANGDNAAPIRIIQTGEGNSTAAVIIGDENSLQITQNSSGAENNAAVNQEGQFNAVSLEQDAAGLVTGLANQAEINQLGQNNSAAVAQTAFAAGVPIFNNRVLINQTGDDNLANSVQLGVNNRSEQEQVGDRNRSEIIQTGNDNLAIHRQFGNDLNTPSFLGGIVIEQTGGASILVEQYSPGAAPLPQ